jgi:predicted CoA-binding protein
MAKLITSASDAFGLLNTYQHIAMVGLSSNPFRPSHFAAIYMLSEGYDVIPVNPRETEILGQSCYPSLTEAANVRDDIEIVDIFRNSKDVPPIVDEAIAIGAKVIWMQLGVVHEAAAQKAIDAGLDVVMDRCVKLEHARFMGGQNLVGLNTGVISAKRLKAMH